MSEFVRVLIGASEKAANIARIIRSEKELFKLLVEEKCDDKKNDRFVHDFKTLSDVLIQECLRREISTVFPAMASNIFGEESNTFTNILGESITLDIKENEQETIKLLIRVLNGNVAAAEILAKEVHRDISTEGNETSFLSNNLIENYADIGVWIDPIDGTNEYIRGSFDDSDNQNGHDQLDPETIFQDVHQSDVEKISTSGLHCVTVLIGAFNMKTGQPIVGVINQPFWRFDPVSKKWQGRKFWGVSTSTQLASSLTRYPLNRDQSAKKVIISSSSEDAKLQEIFKDDFNFVFSSGAGYKLLCVALGLADIYILSKPTVHFWDTCGPHAILKSLGGGIVNYRTMLSPDNDTGQNTHRIEPSVENFKNIPGCDLVNGNKSCSQSSNNSASTRLQKISKCGEITYSVTNQCDKEANYAHLGGIFAYRESVTANMALDCLKKDLC